jgi:hypothetical protein
MFGQGATGMVSVEAPNRRSDDRFRFDPAYTRVVVIPSTPAVSSSAVSLAAFVAAVPASSRPTPANPNELHEPGLEALGLEDFDSGLETPRGGLEGHGYDISLTGMRFELDDELPTNTEVQIEVYPPAEQDPIRMHGVVVRVFSHDDDPGPRRMAVQFTAFATPRDRQRLINRIAARACCWPE